MADLVNQIALWIEGLILAVGYPGIFAVMFLENLIPPIPTDPLLPFAGILAAQGSMTIVGVWIAAVTGALVGSGILHIVGKRAGEPLMRSLVQRYGRWLGMEEAALDRAFALANRYGVAFVIIGRSIPFVRPVVSVTAGMCGIPLPLFLILSGLNSLIVTGIWIFAGYLMGENWREVLGLLDRFEPILTPLLVVAAVVLAGWFLARRLGWIKPKVRETTT
jgi:membrane protein DedA with SNARE-associated domain